MRRTQLEAAGGSVPYIAAGTKEHVRPIRPRLNVRPDAWIRVPRYGRLMTGSQEDPCQTVEVNDLAVRECSDLSAASTTAAGGRGVGAWTSKGELLSVNGGWRSRATGQQLRSDEGRHGVIADRGKDSRSRVVRGVNFGRTGVVLELPAVAPAIAMKRECVEETAGFSGRQAVRRRASGCRRCHLKKEVDIENRGKVSGLKLVRNRNAF